MPREVREALGLAPQAKLAWEVRGGVAVVVPIPEDPVLGSLGILRGPGLTTGDLLEERRRERRREEAADGEQGFGLHEYAGERDRPGGGRSDGGRS